MDGVELSRIPGMYFRYQFFVEIEIPTRNNLAAAGLVQCHHLCQDKSDFVFLGSKIRMVLHASNIWRKLPIHLTDCNVYLFIAPVKVAQFLDTPQFAFAEQPYFWSLDPSGSLKLNEETQKLLGLPSFDTLVVGERWDPIGLSAVRKYMELKKLDPLEYSRAQNYPIFKLSGHICDDDDLEIIDAASEGISSDTLDDKDAWELISKETQADSLHATDDEETIFLPWSQHCPERHPHTYSCSFGLNYTRPKLRELRHSRSCSSLIVNGTIHEPLGDRIHNALYASSQPRQYNIEQNVWQSIEYKNLIPHEHIDYCLNLIDY
ncbi:hypothetical protein BT96DRAFT_224541 [Gymnopus androsaceus JB14]|uniref:Uncharacterized protein n=1 Tax=Gymnopus androsaceus JB14 TaxID=1447944 RepID=A0A6A4H5F2_9AGAR|nr:hypothetical protein BT96DRAFT_224541 [Gymnopus androsaceus JB14]